MGGNVALLSSFTLYLNKLFKPKLLRMDADNMNNWKENETVHYTNCICFILNNSESVLYYNCTSRGIILSLASIHHVYTNLLKLLVAAK